MHEMSLISNLLKKIEELAKKQNSKKVISVGVRLGAFSHISGDHFKEHFELETVGTIAEGAKLNIHTSEDINDPYAQEIILESIEIEE
jgi:hydrogenase nickel incorporation protein HypA/HybF